MPPQQRTILIVDDDHEILESMRTVLENKGFRILAARDGNAGLMIAERENPDLLVLDMMMPKKSGFLVLEKLKSRPGGLIPTIMITGNEGSRHRAYAEMLGVRDYIRKPFAMEKLVRAVERGMGGRTGPDGFGDDEPEAPDARHPDPTGPDRLGHDEQRSHPHVQPRHRPKPPRARQRILARHPE